MTLTLAYDRSITEYLERAVVRQPDGAEDEGGKPGDLQAIRGDPT